MGLNNQEKARKKQLYENLFGNRTGEEQSLKRQWTIQADDVPEFLRLAARSHLSLYHYTSLKSLQLMLKNGTLLLSNVSRLNDLRESGTGLNKRRLKKTYVASFCYADRESVAMWWMYGLKGKTNERTVVPVRLKFNAVAVLKALEAVRKEGSVTCEAENGKAKRAAVADVDFFDILYQFSSQREKDKPGSVSWKHQIANEWCCNSPEALRDAASHFPGFVKDGGWDYEFETRLSVELAQPAGDEIFIPFDKALETVEVLTGPGGRASQYFANTRSALKPEIQVFRSRYEVRFPGEK